MTVVQYLKPVHTGNYQLDEREFLGDLLPPEIHPPPSVTDEASRGDVELHDSVNISDVEYDVLYYLSGYCVHGLIKSEQQCVNCVDSIKHRDVQPHKNSAYLKLRNYKDGHVFSKLEMKFSSSLYPRRKLLDNVRPTCM